MSSISSKSANASLIIERSVSREIRSHLACGPAWWWRALAASMCCFTASNAMQSLRVIRLGTRAFCGLLLRERWGLGLGMVKMSGLWVWWGGVVVSERVFLSCPKNCDYETSSPPCGLFSAFGFSALFSAIIRTYGQYCPKTTCIHLVLYRVEISPKCRKGVFLTTANVT